MFAFPCFHSVEGHSFSRLIRVIHVEKLAVTRGGQGLCRYPELRLGLLPVSIGLNYC